MRRQGGALAVCQPADLPTAVLILSAMVIFMKNVYLEEIFKTNFQYYSL
jgi:hypothetical protein